MPPQQVKDVKAKRRQDECVVSDPNERVVESTDEEEEEEDADQFLKDNGVFLRPQRNIPKNVLVESKVKDGTCTYQSIINNLVYCMSNGEKSMSTEIELKEYVSTEVFNIVKSFKARLTYVGSDMYSILDELNMLLSNHNIYINMYLLKDKKHFVFTTKYEADTTKELIKTKRFKSVKSFIMSPLQTLFMGKVNGVGSDSASKSTGGSTVLTLVGVSKNNEINVCYAPNLGKLYRGYDVKKNNNTTVHICSKCNAAFLSKRLDR